MDLLEIDGSYGEGGGQILRTSATLSLLTGRSIRVTNIRAGRPTPGLRPQHAASLRILQDVSRSRLKGGDIGSTEVVFVPGRFENASFKMDLKTAASITLILQALIPAASLSGAEVEVDLIGGTDVPWSPTLDHLDNVVLPSLRMIGIDSGLTATRRGYYPQGGGRVTAKVTPCRRLKPVELSTPPASAAVSIVSRCGQLPEHVAARQVQGAEDALSAEGISPGNISANREVSDSPGSSILISAVGDDCFIGSDALGKKGKSAEAVGREAAECFLAERRSGANVDSHLSDMLAPILALADSTSTFLVSEISEHLRTSLHIASLFVGSKYEFVKEGERWRVTIIPTV